jgi:cytochrome P450
MKTDIVDPDELVLELLASDEGRADPYSWYHAIRSAAPVHRSPVSGAWYLTRYPDCKDVLIDPRFGRGNQQGVDRFGGLGGEEVTCRRQN